MAIEALQGPASHDTHTGQGHDAHHGHHLSPTARLWQIIREDRADLTVLLIYTIVTGLLALIVPVAAQSLVNTISQRIFIQNVIVLTLIVLGIMVIVGALRLLQLSLVETLQQRIFARTALKLADRLPRVKNTALAGEYAPELVNRFFDVLTIQKTFAKLALGGLGAMLQASVGLVLLAFYDSTGTLLGFDVFILGFVIFIFFVLGIGGLRTSIRESIQKYRVAEWLQELARCQTSFKMDGKPDYLVDCADGMVIGYLTARRRHFRVTFRQAIGNYLFQAMATAGTLGLGGKLVIEGKLTLGQLVAAELIIVSVLASLEKLIGTTEDFYDLLTGLDKVGHLEDMPLERSGGRLLPAAGAGVSVVCRGVHFAYEPGMEVLSGLDLKLEAGERISLVGASGAGKTTLAALLCGLEETKHGSVEVGGLEVRQTDLNSLREITALVGDNNEIFNGTVEENILVGRSQLTPEEVRWAIETAGLTADIARLPQGVQTPLVSAGRNISRGQMQRILVARAIVDRPRLLILDEAFTGIDERTKIAILDALYHPDNRWTIIDISHDAEVVMRSRHVYVLQDGKFGEQGVPEELAQKPDSAFAALFPDLSRRIRARQTI